MHDISIRAGSHQTGAQGVLEHIGAAPGILADDDLGLLALLGTVVPAQEPTDLYRMFKGQILIGLAAETVRREWSFNLRMLAEDALTPEELEAFTGTTVLVQGTIDLCFIEDGKWILLDYKTDRSSDIDAIRDHYSRQLQLYAAALERITGIAVNEKLLCLLRREMILKM